MALTNVSVVAKDGAGTSIPGGIRQHDTSGAGTGPNIPEAIIVDTAGGEVLGTTADAAVAAGASGSIGAKLRAMSRDLITRASSLWAAGSGAGLTWTDAFSTATLNSIASGNAILSDLSITNGSALDKYMDVSIALASVTTPNTDGLCVSIHLYPLNADGTSYGDGRFGSSATGPCLYPPVATIPIVKNVTQAQTGTAVGIVIPPGTFKLVLANNGGVALASTGNTCKYRTYN